MPEELQNEQKRYLEGNQVLSDVTIERMSPKELIEMQELLQQLQAKVSSELAKKSAGGEQPAAADGVGATSEAEQNNLRASEKVPQPEVAQQAFETFLQQKVATAKYSEIQGAIRAFIGAYPEGTPDEKYSRNDIIFLKRYGLMDAVILFSKNAANHRSQQVDKLTQISPELGDRIQKIQGICQAFILAYYDTRVPALERYNAMERAVKQIVLVLGKEPKVNGQTVMIQAALDEHSRASQSDFQMDLLSRELQGLQTK